MKRVTRKKRRSSPSRAELHPVEIWVPDTRSPEFAAECKRQSELVFQADALDVEMIKFMDKALSDAAGWAG